MRLFISLSLLLFSLVTHAEASLPKGCAALAVQGDSVTLSAKTPKVIFIHNLSQTDLWLTHPVVNASASAGWTSRIQADHWSALAVDKASFIISCIESTPGHEQGIPCEGAIAVCQWKGAKIPEKEKGTFWAGEDLNLAELIAAIGGRGFVLPHN